MKEEEEELGKESDGSMEGCCRRPFWVTVTKTKERRSRFNRLYVATWPMLSQHPRVSRRANRFGAHV
jgi:hypothetical protein